MRDISSFEKIYWAGIRRNVAHIKQMNIDNQLDVLLRHKLHFLLKKLLNFGYIRKHNDVYTVEQSLIFIRLSLKFSKESCN